MRRAAGAGAEERDALVRTRATRLLTDPSGRRIEAIEVEQSGRTRRVEAPLVVLSAGAVNSAALLLQSANDKHRRGLANSSGLVGTRYMAHLATMMQGFHPFRTNDTVFQKTVAINDFYFKGPRTAYPLGQIQSQGRTHGVMAQTVVPSDAAMGLRRVGGARRGLAGDDRGSAARREPHDVSLPTAAFSCTTVRTTSRLTRGWSRRRFGCSAGWASGS